MPAARFYIDAPLAPGTQLDLPPSVAHHATRVLRLREGGTIILFNGRGGEFHAQLSVKGKRPTAEIQTFDPVEREARLPITLVQSWIATEKLDWVVEKSVELGVHAILLAPAQRSLVRLAGDRLARRIERLRDLATAACAQCGRNIVPPIAASATLECALREQFDDSTIRLMLEPSASDEIPLSRNALINRPVRIVVGPEGGFESTELTLARDAGYRACRLGPRILRTETAGIVALAALQALAGDLCTS
ncbi:MAG: 16S rRNA (uracil(1498)-N(3))-methyltransferase [Burkholderiaceae bacterium]